MQIPVCLISVSDSDFRLLTPRTGTTHRLIGDSPGGCGLARNARKTSVLTNDAPLLQTLVAIDRGLTLTFLWPNVGQKRLACMLAANGWNKIFQCRDCFHCVSFQPTPGNLQVSSGHFFTFLFENCAGQLWNHHRKLIGMRADIK